MTEDLYLVTSWLENTTADAVTWQPDMLPGELDLHPEILVVSNEWERLVTFGFGMVLAVWTIAANSAIARVFIRRFGSNDADPHDILLLAITVGETMVVICGGVIMGIGLTLEESTPLLACRMLSDVVIASYFVLIYLVALVSVERYCYFCQPFRYNQLFSCKKVVLVVLLTVCAVYLWVIIPEVLIGRTMLYANLYCQLDDDVVPKTYLAFCFAPSVVAVVFSCFMILRLMREKELQVSAAHLPQYMNNRQVPSITRLARSALRVIILLSGLLFITHLPTTIIRRYVLNSSVTWDDINSRKAFVEAISLRISSFVKALLSPAVSPCILLYVNKQLKVSCWALIKKGFYYPRKK